MRRNRTLRLNLATGAAALLLAGCGGSAALDHPTPTPTLTSPGTGIAVEGDGTPTAEGTGTGAPQRPSHDGTSLSLPTLPIGSGGPGNVTDEFVCVSARWLGHLRSGAHLTVTGVLVNGPFKLTDPATAGCAGEDGPRCVGLQLTGADNNTLCAVGLKWTGVRATRASLELTGELSCPGLRSAACHQVLSDLEQLARAQGPLGFDFNVPPPVMTSSPPETPSTPATPVTSPASPSGASSS